MHLTHECILEVTSLILHTRLQSVQSSLYLLDQRGVNMLICAWLRQRQRVLAIPSCTGGGSRATGNQTSV